MIEVDDATRLNWLLLQWRGKAGLLTIGLGREDHEVWTHGSLRVALVQLLLKGTWNAEVEAAAGPFDVAPAPIDLYRSVPMRLVSGLIHLRQPVAELRKMLDIKVRALEALVEGVDIVIPSGTRLTPDDFVWLVLASVAAGKDLHLYPEQTA